MGHWKGKLDDDEMTDAVPTLNGRGARAVADIEAELERVAQLLSGLSTNVKPGMYASALEALLSSVSSVLQLELEQKRQAPGTTGTHHAASPESPPRRPAAHWRWASCSSPFDRQLLARWLAWQLPNVRVSTPTPIPPASRRGAQPNAAEYGPAFWHRPILFTLECMQCRMEARMRISSCMPRCRSRTDVMLLLLSAEHNHKLAD
jgi:hypothetical protein